MRPDVISLALRIRRQAEPLASAGCQMTGPNDKGHRANGAPKIHTQSQDLDCANDGGERKALATMKARAARCGCSLHEMAGGAFLVSRSDYSRAAPCLRSVGDLLRQIGGRQ
jgi:hypothetical protein